MAQNVAEVVADAALFVLLRLTLEASFTLPVISIYLTTIRVFINKQQFEPESGAYCKDRRSISSPSGFFRIFLVSVKYYLFQQRISCVASFTLLFIFKGHLEAFL